jgi:hypothetical protein
MNKFVHSILTDMGSEERWLKIFPRKVFVSAIAKLSIPMLLIYFNGLTVGTLVFAAIVAVWAIVWAILSIIEKNANNYLSGGGRTLTDLFWKKLYFRQHKSIYTLGIDSYDGVG